MHKTAVAYALGKLMQVMGVMLLIPLGIALWDSRENGLSGMLEATDVFGIMVSIAIALVFGSALVMLGRRGREHQGLREGYAIVTIGWFGLTFIGCLPLFFYFLATRDAAGANGWLLAFTDSFFEIMSGFTTTGATILTDIEVVPRSLLFLRSLAHWLGGMGIITLAIVIFPAMGVSGYGMYRGEVPGPSPDRLRPRLAQTAQILWGVYMLLTAVEMVLLMAVGMNWFDAINHAFATMATGGFSTKNASIAAFDSDLVEWIIIIFMYFAGINFLLHFKALRGDFKSMFRDREYVFYSAVVAVVILILTAVLFVNGPAPLADASQHYRAGAPTETEFIAHYTAQAAKLDGMYDSFRIAAFQTLAIVTTTGFATADFDIWPDFLRFLLVLLMFFGGCAGSTGGGMKMVRIMVVFKVALNELRKLTQPRLVSPIKVGGQPIDDAKVVNVVSFFILFTGLFVLVGMLLTLFMPDMTTAFSASIATIGNIGPGLAGVGAVENYAWIPIPAKWLLVLSMLLGRLEIFTVLIILRPSIWRK